MLVIRQYQDTDLDSLNQLLDDAYQGFGFTRKGRGDLANKEFVALLEDQVVGYAILTKLYDPIEDIYYGHVNYVGVLKKYQNKKIATKIFEEIFKLCKEEEISYLELTSNSSRVAAHYLYKKLGFVIRNTDVFRKEIL